MLCVPAIGMTKGPSKSELYEMTESTRNGDAAVAERPVGTVGGVVSGVELLTVMFTAVEVAVLPAASRATAVRLWALFEAKVVFQDEE